MDDVEQPQEEQEQAVQGETPKDIAVVIRPALKRACCENDACRAAILNQILYCIAWKQQQGKDFWYGTYEEICSTLLDNSWGKSKVIKELNILIEQGYLEQRRNPKKGWDQTRQYLFGVKQAKKLRESCEKSGICAHQIGFPPIIVHLLNLTNAFSKNKNCIACFQQMQLSESTNPSVKNNKAIPKTSTKTSSKTTPKNPGATESPEEEHGPHGREINNDNKNITQFREASPPPERPIELGFAKMAMREWLLYSGDSLDNFHILSQANEICEASGLPRQDFRSEVNKITNDFRRNGNRDSKAFLNKMRLVMPAKQLVVMEG